MTNIKSHPNVALVLFAIIGAVFNSQSLKSSLWDKERYRGGGWGAASQPEALPQPAGVRTQHIQVECPLPKSLTSRTPSLRARIKLSTLKPSVYYASLIISLMLTSLV